jgi:phage-related protein
MGLMPNNYKPMSTVGSGTYEIRVQDADGIARLMYVAKFDDTICVLHVFTKKSPRTPKADIDIAKKRYREVRDG